VIHFTIQNKESYSTPALAGIVTHSLLESRPVKVPYWAKLLIVSSDVAVIMMFPESYRHSPY
jgi:hypothetical protein